MNSYKKNILYLFIFLASLIMIFEVDLRNIGHLETDPVESISMLPGIYLSDFGLFLPFFIVFLTGRFKSILTRKGLLYFLLFIIFYGLAVSIIRNNPLHMLGTDIRIPLALLTGLSMGLLLSQSLKILAVGITIAACMSILIVASILFSLPDANFIQSFERTTHPSAFILSGIPLVLMAPAMILSTLISNYKLIAISWFSAGMFLIIMILIMQTRSVSIAFTIGIIIVLITTLILSYYYKGISKQGMKTQKIGLGKIAIFLSVILVILYWLRDYVEIFLLRLQAASSFEADVGIVPRLAELPLIFEPMNLTDHLFGMGFNPASSLVDWQGNSYNTSHVGIINIWWRLGLPTFLALLYLFVKLLIRWLGSLKRLCSNSSRYIMIDNETKAIIVCTPGVIVLFIISCMSGGWAVSAMVPLGILWGVYKNMIVGHAASNDALRY